MRNKNILISGASIAGPATAYWLRRYGFNPTVVERAPALREGGSAVDFRGEAHMTVLRRMGILDDVRRMQTAMGAQTVVDENGRQLASLPSEFMSGEVEILRGDLSRILYDRTKDETEYIFGDWITSMTETSDGVHVSFQRSAPRTFDLVIGADGLHSGVRALAFGAESRFSKFLGYYVAAYSLPNYLNLDHTGLLYNEPGKGASIGSIRHNAPAGTLFVFESPELDFDRRDVGLQRKILAETYADVGWEVPKMIDAMWDSPDFYFDSISQIHMDHWTKGRVGLVGDAGYGATCGGMGTGLAIVCSYVLAGELAAAGGDHRTAFARYEQEIRDYAKGCQRTSNNAGPFLAPGSRGKIWRRNQIYKLLSTKAMSNVFNKMTTKAASAITLKTY